MDAVTPTIDNIRHHMLGDSLRRSSAGYPRKLAMACGDTRWTYVEFDALADGVAASLAERLPKVRLWNFVWPNRARVAHGANSTV
jgi:acyl-CoA synthetase (AMP-forming)/AMP-acid ligase II